MRTRLLRAIRHILPFDLFSTAEVNIWFVYSALSLASSIAIVLLWELFGRMAGSIHLMSLALLLLVAAATTFIKGALTRNLPARTDRRD